ncbi:MAG: tetratricopeptide repeat protein [Candidatus Promineifilaceae bacterium]
MLKFHLLGRPQVILDDTPVTDFASEKELLLLCYLACNPGEHGRTQLAGLLWSEMSDERARANLSTAIYNLRQLLPDAIEATRKTAALNPEQPVWLDTEALQDAAVEAGESSASAVEQYRGLFLEGIYPQNAPELESWLQQERERWRLLALTILDRLSHEQTMAGKWEQAITTLRRLLNLEPWREESHRLLMRLLASDGRFNEALVQYETCRALLQEELGVEPMAQTTAVYERIRAARQRTHQDNLPQYPTPLVGRANEMGKLFTWLHDPERRLITIGGPGGSGKTRLAATAAERHGYAFLDGAYYIHLTEADSEAAFVQAIASVLGLTLTAGKETNQLLDYLCDKELLLVLDNVEQALEPTADFVVALLEAASHLRLIVTSREYLRLRWETRLPLDGLPVPPGNGTGLISVDSFDAVRLFIQTAQRVQPAFRLNGDGPSVVALCRMVEGLPLAIELAAALVEYQTPNQLLDQVEQSFDSLTVIMRDLPKRHRGLRAVFDYSWTLLTPTEQVALARLALFRGGFTGQAAEAVAQAKEPILTALAAKSLVRKESDGRYSLHSVIGQYSLERLENREQAAGEHAAYFANLIERATADLHGPKQTAVARQLLADLANIEAGWQTAVNSENVDLLLSMAPGLTRFYQAAGLFQAGLTTFSAALDGLPAAPPTLTVYQAAFLVEKQEYGAAKTAVEAALAAGLNDPALLAQAHLIMTDASMQPGHLEAAQESVSLAMAEGETAQMPWLQAQAWRKMGDLAERVGDYDQAEEAVRQALKIYEASGDPLGLAQTYHALSIVVFRRGDMKATKELLEKTLAVRRQIDTSGLNSARVLVNLGSVVGNLGQEEEAQQYFQEALAVFHQTGDRSGAALASDMLGEASACRYEFEEARTYLEQALSLRQEIGQRKGIADARRHLADLALRLGSFGKARQILMDVLETYQSIQERRSLGTTLARLALVNCYQDDYETAEQQAKEALDIADEIGNPLLQAYALSSLGHSLRGQEKWEQAATVYAEAILGWEEWGEVGLTAEIQAALASVHYAAGRAEEAWPLLEAAVSCLVNNPQPDCDQLGRLYLDCIMLLQSKGDEDRAAQLRQQAVITLNRQAAGIAQEQDRAAYLTGINAHRQLFALTLT